MKRWIVSLLLATGLAWSASASAQAQTVGVRWSTPMYAGPSTGYPVVGHISAGAFVTLNGCLGDYAWCEVNDGLSRGWVEPDNLAVYQNSVPYAFYDATPWFTYPIVSFYIGDYWGRYYSNRPWYRDRYRYDRWDWRQGNRGWDRPRPPHHGHRPPPVRPPRPNDPPVHRPPHQGPNFPGRPPIGPGNGQPDWNRPTPTGPDYTRPNYGPRPSYQRNNPPRTEPGRPPISREQGRPAPTSRPTPRPDRERADRQQEP